MALTFVYRSHYLGQLSKHVVRLEDTSVLAWFQRHWGPASTSADPHEYLRGQLGADVYGLASLFIAAKEEKLPAPRGLATLRKYIDEHLYTEGEARLDAHSLRVLTDDDEVQLAYFFFDDACAEPERVAYLQHEGFPLPTDAAKKSAFPCPVSEHPLEPAASGKGRTWALFLTFYDSESLPFGPVPVFEGIRLPELAAHLKAASASGPGSPVRQWSPELRLLRAALGNASSPQQALERCMSYPLHEASQHKGFDRATADEPAKAWLALQKLTDEQRPREKHLPSVALASEHLWQLTTHQSDFFGYQQWFLFDDLWASANRALAASLLRHAHGWDPWSDDDEDGPGSG